MWTSNLQLRCAVCLSVQAMGHGQTWTTKQRSRPTTHITINHKRQITFMGRKREEQKHRRTPAFKKILSNAWPQRWAYIAGLIPQSIQLQTQIRLASLVGRVRSSVRADQCVSAVSAVEALVKVCLRSSCNHVTEVVVRYGRETGADGCHASWRGLCGFNPASLKSLSCAKCL